MRDWPSHVLFVPVDPVTGDVAVELERAEQPVVAGVGDPGRIRANQGRRCRDRLASRASWALQAL